jgi:hypothetical protein
MRACLSTLVAASILVLVSGTVGAQPSDGEAPPDNEHYALRGELGAEFDSNATRTETISGTALPARVRSFLQRLVLSGTLSDVVSPRHAVAVSATAAAKLFDAPAARGENVAIAQSSGAWRIRLGEQARLTASGTYYEAFQTAKADPTADAERRDFRSLIPALQLGWAASESIDLSLTGGWRWLVFKSDRDFDFAGPTAALDLRWARQREEAADWEAGTGAAIEHRRFGGPAFTDMCTPAGLPCPGADVRSDDLLTGRVEVTRTGRALVGAGYVFAHNMSNSFGDTVTRHFAILRMAASLPFDISLAARADLLFAHYRDRVNVSAGSGFVSVEDENRSSARVDLSRGIWERLRLLARYTIYVSELGSDAASYLRQTFLLSLAYAIEK